MSTATVVLVREYEYLRRLEGRDFFLGLEPYTQALVADKSIAKAMHQLDEELVDAQRVYEAEIRQFIEDARVIRTELAERAPEVDNSDMQAPDEVSHEWVRYDLHSFARFDELADEEVSIQFPSLPTDQGEPGYDGQLLEILRSRLLAAEYGENGPPNRPKIRHDLDDLARRISNLREASAHALRRYRQQSRTLPGLAFRRLVDFGVNLNPEPLLIEQDEDMVRRLDRMLREAWTPTRTIRKLVNGEHMAQFDREHVSEIEATLKSQLDRLHQELLRQVPARRRVVELMSHPLVLLVLGGVVTIALKYLAEVLGIRY